MVLLLNNAFGRKGIASQVQTLPIHLQPDDSLDAGNGATPPPAC